ncbi:MAG: BACON domain-containing protein [Alistipes sp.]|nr:BACON domain-containing protein [Alistipes sp.]
MKKFFALCGIVATLLVACEAVDNKTNTPEETSSFTITSKTDISINAGSTMGFITYTINTPVEGATIEATADAEWIGSFDYSQMGKIGYKVEANTSYDAREGKVTVSYNGTSVVIALTQAGKARPEEITVNVDYALGHYFGDYANINYNYYLVLSTSDYDANGSFYAAGEKFFLDIYAEERPEDYNNIRVPNGVYTFNPNNDGKAGTFLQSYSLYKKYDISGAEVDERAYSEGTLTVTDDMIKLEVVFDDEINLYVVTYNGDHTMIDKRSECGAIY